MHRIVMNYPVIIFSVISVILINSNIKKQQLVHYVKDIFILPLRPKTFDDKKKKSVNDLMFKRKE